jgi:hypothetical protein
MGRALKAAAELGGMCQWVAFLYLASTVALSAASPYLRDRSTTIALVVSMVVGACIEIWSIDWDFQKTS